MVDVKSVRADALMKKFGWDDAYMRHLLELLEFYYPGEWFRPDTGERLNYSTVMTMELKHLLLDSDDVIRLTVIHDQLSAM